MSPIPALLVTVSILAAPAQAAPPVDDVEEVREATRAVLASPAEARGDDAALFESWRTLLEERPASPAAELVLLRLREHLDRVPDLVSFEPGLVSLVEGDATPPRTRVLARSMLVSVLRRQGRFDEAREVLAGSGLVRSWLVAGPVGTGRDVDHDLRPAPERAALSPELEAGRVFEGPVRPVRWRPVSLLPEEARLDGRDLTGGYRGAWVACAHLRVDGAREAFLWIDGPRAHKVWVDGRLAFDGDRTRREVGDAIVPLRLEEGWHRLTVKVVRSGPISCGLTDRAGRALDATWEREGATHAFRPGTVEVGDPVRKGALAAYDALVSEHPDVLPFLAARALALHDRGLASQSVRDARALGERVDDDDERAAALLYQAARRVRRAGGTYLPPDRVRAEARALLDRAAAIAPEHVWVQLRIARDEAEDDRIEEAAALLGELVTRAPRNPTFPLARVDLFLGADWVPEARVALRTARSLAPDDRRVLLARARVRRALGDAPGRDETWARLFELDPSALRVGSSLAERLAARGEVEAAIEMRERVLAADRSRTGDLWSLARLRARADDLEGAERALGRLARLRPFDARVPFERAKLLLRAGERERAVRALRAVLDLSPGRADVREMLAELAPETREEDPQEAWATPLEEVLDEVPAPSRYPDASTIGLLDETVVRVFPDGSADRLVHQVHLIVDSRGVQDFHNLTLPGDVLEVRTLVPREGEQEDGPVPPGTTLSSAVPGYEVLEPVQGTGTREILPPGLAPGVILEVKFRMRGAGGSAPGRVDLSRFYFRDPNLNEPFHRTRYAVLAPAGMELETIERNLGDEVRRVDERGERFRRLAWSAREMDRVRPAPGLPPREDFLPWVQVRTPMTWDRVRATLRDAVLGRVVRTEDVRRAAREATDGATTDREKIEAIWTWVTEHVTEPRGGRTASEILAARGGSRTVVLLALLREAGVRAAYARATPAPELLPEPLFAHPRPDPFNQELILCEPEGEEPLWIYPNGPRLMPVDRIPVQIQGGTALVASRHGERFAVVPSEPLDRSALHMSFDVRLDGVDATVGGRIEMRDVSSYQAKEQVRNAPPAQIRNGVSQMVNSLFRGASIEGLEFPGLRRAGSPLVFAFDADVPGHVQELDGRPGISPGIAPLRMVRSYGGRPEREVPYQVSGPRLQRDRVVVDTGPDWAVDELPEDLFVRHEAGTYSLSFRLERSEEGDRVILERAVNILPTRLSPAEYPDFLDLCRRIDDAEEARIGLRPR